SACKRLTRWLRMAFAAWRAVHWRMSGLFGRPSLHLPDLLFHFLPRFERDDELLGHKDFVARSGVASFSRGTLFYLKNAEIPQFDAVIFDQRGNDGIEGLLDDFLGLKLREPDLLGNGFDDLFLGHFGIPS